MPNARLAVLISGRGSNLRSLIDATKAPEFPADIELVISNRPKAPGLQYATAAGIPQSIIDHKDFETREDFDAALDAALRMAKADYVCLAGFMRILTPQFVNDWRGRLINIHPSLLPAFKGLHVHERMIDAGVKIAGCTVHFVSADADSGPIIGQAAIPVRPGETPASLAERILEEEHKLYPACVRLIVEAKARLSGGSVLFDSSVVASGAVLNPPFISD
ncbi:MAG: phosphoribosylglycinamide formyltransferase [Hyphococcus sp.]